MVRRGGQIKGGHKQRSGVPICQAAGDPSLLEWRWMRGDRCHMHAHENTSWHEQSRIHKEADVQTNVFLLHARHVISFEPFLSVTSEPVTSPNGHESRRIESQSTSETNFAVLALMHCRLKAMQQVISPGVWMWCLGCEAFEHSPGELKLEKLVPPLVSLVKNTVSQASFHII